ncbi:MAG: hypothetical protein ACRELB_03530, partial [Polyangiaceae bacterium]
AAQFRMDAQVALVYRQLGRELPAQSYLLDLVRRYPDADYATLGFFQTARRYYDLDRPAAPGATPSTRPRKMYEEAYATLKEFTAFHPASPLAADAQWFAVQSLVNLGQYGLAAFEAEKIPTRYEKSQWVDDALYTITLCHFQEGKYDDALTAGVRLLTWREVRSDGRSYESEFVPQVELIFAKIFHARGDIAKAVDYYRMVADRFEDARDALAFFTASEIKIDDVIAAPPGANEVPVRWRNVSKLKMKLYPVDLLLLLAKERSLGDVSSIDLTGVAPRREMEVALEGEKYRWNVTRVPMPVDEKGVYLVVAKADSIDVTTLLILSDVRLELQRVGDSVRVYAIGKRDGKPIGDAFVTVSDGSRVVARGRTDARGLFEARGAGSAVTVVAEKDGSYALAREGVDAK